MPRTTILRRECNEFNLEKMVMEATSGDGLAVRAGQVFAGSLPIVVAVIVGPACDGWVESFRQYHEAMGVSNEQTANSGSETGNQGLPRATDTVQETRPDGGPVG